MKSTKNIKAAAIVTAVAGLVMSAAIGFQSISPAYAQTQAQPPRQTDPNRPAQPGRTDPANPNSEQPNRNPNDPNRPVVIPDRERDEDDIIQNPNRGGYQRPFAFVAPQYESTFSERTRGLAQMEQRLERSNQEMMKKIGEARSLSGERQNQAVLDILQTMARDHQAMHQYLVQSRTAWSGDISDEADDRRPIRPEGDQPRNPNNTNPNNPNNPRNPNNPATPPR